MVIPGERSRSTWALDCCRSSAIIVCVRDVARCLRYRLKLVRIIVGVLLQATDGGLLGQSVTVVVVRVNVVDVERAADTSTTLGQKLVDVVVRVARRKLIATSFVLGHRTHNQ